MMEDEDQNQQRKTTYKQETQIRGKEHPRSKCSLIFPEREEDGMVENRSKEVFKKKKRQHREIKKRKTTKGRVRVGYTGDTQRKSSIQPV